MRRAGRSGAALEEGAALNVLKRRLLRLAPGEITEPGPVAALLASCWHEFKGSTAERMHADKLGRMQDVRWAAPVLSFTVERHGIGAPDAILAEQMGSFGLTYSPGGYMRACATGAAQLYQRGEHIGMSAKRIVRRTLKSRQPGKTDWARVDAISDPEIENAVKSDPDAAPILDNAWFRKAKLVLPERKVAISLRMDREVVEWFKAHGRRYQSRMNAVLKAYVQAHR